MKKQIIIGIFYCGIAISSISQDVHFSQFTEAPQFVNPALVGFFAGDHRFIANFRNQWKSIGSPYQTYAVSYDMGLNKLSAETGYLAAGIIVYRDKAGDLSLGTNQAVLNVGYHLQLNEFQTFGAAISGGMGQKSIDMTDARWDLQYDPSYPDRYNPSADTREPNYDESFMYPDIGFGIHYSIKGMETRIVENDGFRANFGLGIYHINSPKMKFNSNSDDTRLSPRISAHGQGLIGIPHTNLSLCPGFFYFSQNKTSQVFFGSSFRYLLREHSKYTGFINDAYFSIGGYHRLRDAIIIMTQIELNDFAIGISYDINVSGLRVATNGRGGPELSLRYIIVSTAQKSYY